MSIIQELINDLVDYNKSLTNTLRKAKILASKSNIPEMSLWIKNELEGYNEKEQIPEYRKQDATNLGFLRGPFGSQMRNVAIPVYNLPESIKEFAETCIIGESIGQLESLISSEGEVYNRKWPAEYLMIARNYIHLSGGFVLDDITQPLSKAVFAGIIDNVKNKLLDFLLEIDHDNIDLEGITMNSDKHEKIRSSFSINVYGSNNNVATGEIVNQNNLIVEKNDVESLKKFLKENHISDNDVNDLEQSIKQDSIKGKYIFGEKVSLWIGKMISKAASGAWDVALNVAPTLLTDALNKFFGIG